MARRTSTQLWHQVLRRSFNGLARQAQTQLKAHARRQASVRGIGRWVPGAALSPQGLRRFHLYLPQGLQAGLKLPLMVMLHGCGQDAASFAALTRMNRLAERHRFLVLYPEQDRLANPQGCWNWFDSRGGRAEREAASILAAIHQVSLLHPVDTQRVAVAGLSAGASMAALLALREPARFKAVIMHSGVAPDAAHSTLGALRAMRGRTPLTLPQPPVHAAPLPPLLVIQGALDHVVDPGNGPAAAQRWVLNTGAEPTPPRVLQRGGRHPMVVTDFKRGPACLATWIQVQGMGHAWSGGLNKEAFSDPLGPNASQLAWAFAARQWKA